MCCPILIKLLIKQLFLIFSGSCGHFKQFEELSQQFKEKLPNTEVQGREGRRGEYPTQTIFVHAMFYILGIIMLVVNIIFI